MSYQRKNKPFLLRNDLFSVQIINKCKVNLFQIHIISKNVNIFGLF